MRQLLFVLCTALLTGALAFGQGSSLKIGQKVPDFQLVNQEGKSVKLSDFKGKVILITFLYTQCPYPDKCPMLAQKLNKTKDLLDQMEGSKERFQVISITLDPKRDTPEHLKEYAQGMDQGSTNWAFLTGKPNDIAKVASMFDVIYYTEKGVIEHNMRTAVLDGNLKLRRMIKGNEWKPGEIATAVRDLLK